jgi:SpoVK/Ycf46/Vps4 family AAA+-type ATPase
VDAVFDAGGSPGAALVLKSRLLLNEGDLDGARDAYRRALAADPELADPELAALLVAPEETTEEREEPAQEVAATPSAERVDPDRAVVTFADVGGMEDVKEEIRLKIIHPFQHPEELFERARRSVPCVLFFDEVDALGARRSDMRSSPGRQLIPTTPSRRFGKLCARSRTTRLPMGSTL